MDSNRKTYYYKKQLNGKGRFGGTELELINTTDTSEIIDQCKWTDFIKESNPFEETPPILNSYKTYILKLLNFIILKYSSQQPIKLILHDIKILIIDTTPSQIIASTILGCFDLLGKPLDSDEIKIIDNFIISNENVDYPNFKNLVIELFNKKASPL